MPASAFCIPIRAASLRRGKLGARLVGDAGRAPHAAGARERLPRRLSAWLPGLLFLNLFVEVALEAVTILRGKASLHLAFAERARDQPASSASVCSAIISVKRTRGRRRTGAQFVFIFAAWLTTAILELPAIILLCHRSGSEQLCMADLRSKHRFRVNMSSL
jgi:hypothetical protein